MKLSTIVKTLLIVLFLQINSIAYAYAKADRFTGSWEITASVNAEVVYKNWTGIITVSREGNVFSAVLDWSSENGEWHVVQDMSVSKNGREVTLQGTSVNIIIKPEHMTEYLPDTFKFNLDDKTDNTIPVMAGDTNGTSMTFTINKL